MSVPLDLPPATLRRLEAEAARRGVGIDVVIADLGASGGTRFARDADELLAEGLGRS
jgi:hypothetical protein